MSDSSHAALMDRTYRYQRLFYDVTRRYYLLGRDRLIADLDPPPDGTVLEIACGTGRNLALIARRYPGRRVCGLDISEEMLRSARAKLGSSAVLAQGDACAFDPQALFGVAGFDRVILSYSLSMIPDWQGALGMAAHVVAPGGRLCVVDFGGQSALPRWFRSGLRAWLARFHVSPRDDLEQALRSLSQNGLSQNGLSQDGLSQDGLSQDGAFRFRFSQLFRDYAVYGTLDRQA